MTCMKLFLHLNVWKRKKLSNAWILRLSCHYSSFPVSANTQLNYKETFLVTCIYSLENYQSIINPLELMFM
jgi:hypothetical protein